MNFNFRLAYNSSMLNSWTSTPLVLAGLWTVQCTPQAVRTDGKAQSTNVKIIHDFHTISIVGNKSLHIFLIYYFSEILLLFVHSVTKKLFSYVCLT